MKITERFKPEIETIDSWLLTYFNEHNKYSHPGYKKLVESIQYSLKSGGKRFRPLLSVLTAEALARSIADVRPISLAVEFIHTYSLIHDDLPCIDDDDERRGHPTNHKVFGEGFALLAGDALLTESLFVLANELKCSAEQKVEVIRLISQAAGIHGMVGGQSMDVFLPEGGQSEEQINWVHELKTGALISVSVQAAAVVCGASADQQQGLKHFASNLGFAFQLADDIEDYDESCLEPTSYTSVHGLEETKNKLQQVSQLALENLTDFSSADGLKWLTEFNVHRVLSKSE